MSYGMLTSQKHKAAVGLHPDVFLNLQAILENRMADDALARATFRAARAELDRQMGVLCEQRRTLEDAERTFLGYSVRSHLRVCS